MKPDSLPEEYLEVNGFRRVKGNSGYVEWRRTDGRKTVNVWAEFGARGPPVIEVLYEVKKGGRLIDQGEVATVEQKRTRRSSMWKDAIQHAVNWMRAYGKNASGGSGDLPTDLDFS